MSKLRAIGALPERDGDLPIPDGVQPNRYWTDSMREMAAHIGAHATLMIVDRFGGMELYVPQDPSKCAAFDLIGADPTAKLCKIYGKERLPIPVAASAVRHAKSQPVLAAVRANQISLTDAVQILRQGGIKTSRTYLSGLLNATDQGSAAQPWTPRRLPDARQLVMFDDVGEAA